MTVLVLAAETDRTADSVVTGLTERNVPVMRIDTSWFPQQMILDAEFRGPSPHGVGSPFHDHLSPMTLRPCGDSPDNPAPVL